MSESIDPEPNPAPGASPAPVHPAIAHLAHEHSQIVFGCARTLDARREHFRDWVATALGTEPDLAAYTVDALCGEQGILHITDYSIDFDIPIPLVMDVELYSRIALRSTAGAACGFLALHYSEETYDVAYRCDLYFKPPDGLATTINKWPDWSEEQEESALGAGLDLLRTRLGVAFPDRLLIELLVRALAPVGIREVLRAHLTIILDRARHE